MTPREFAEAAIRCWNENDREGWSALADDDFTFEGVQYGRQGWTGLYDAMHSAFADSKMHVYSVVESGDACACEIEFTGTHVGTLMMPRPSGQPYEVPATGKQVTVNWALFETIKDGKVKTFAGYGFPGGLIDQGAYGISAPEGAPLQPSRPGTGIPSGHPVF